MILWFAVVGGVLVWRVFRSPQVDYRLVMLGAALPIVDVAVGRATPLHTIAVPIALLFVVMVGARGRRLTQRQWLGVPIGMLVHLVLDGTWADTGRFWWPITGAQLEGTVPEASWPLGVNLALDAIALLMLWWLWFRLGFNEADHRARFLRTGHLDRELA